MTYPVVMTLDVVGTIEVPVSVVGAADVSTEALAADHEPETVQAAATTPPTLAADVSTVHAADATTDEVAADKEC